MWLRVAHRVGLEPLCIHSRFTQPIAASPQSVGRLLIERGLEGPGSAIENRLPALLTHPPDEAVVTAKASCAQVGQNRVVMPLEIWGEHTSRGLGRAKSRWTGIDYPDARTALGQLIRDSTSDNAGADDQDIRGSSHALQTERSSIFNR